MNDVDKIILDFNPEWTWEYNLITKIRWDTNDKEDDMVYYIRKWIDIISEDESLNNAK